MHVEKGNVVEEAPRDSPELVSDRPAVMIVDDDPLVAESLQITLEDEYRLIVCSSGQEALKRIDDDVDVVVLDIRMTGLDGFATDHEIKARHPHLPIIFHSAYQDVKDPFDVMNEHRPFGFIVKGKDPPDMLLSLIERAVRFSRTMSSLTATRQLLENVGRGE